MCLFLLPFLNARFLSEVSLQMAGSGFVSLVCIIIFLFHQKKLSEQSFNVADILGYYTLDFFSALQSGAATPRRSYLSRTLVTSRWPDSVLLLLYSL